VITTWTGGPAQNGGRVVACGDATLHAAVLEALGAVR
jgi:myo-inositol-1(or 4)-monophosphatase